MINRVPFHQLGFQFLEIESLYEPNLLFETLPEYGLGIVGTRYPQKKSFDLLEKSVKELKSSKLTIISGLARGIDSKAHELAIENQLKTIAILGCGLKVDYPKENRLLRKKILEEGGMIISPYEQTSPALPHHFLERNQLIAYFSKAVWVVEASAISGSLNTASHASEQGRDLYATSCFPGDHFMEGNQKLLSQFEPNRYPIAEPFFSSKSLEKSWPSLNIKHEKKKLFNRNSISRIQKWVLELKEINGECKILMLMNLAMSQGLEPGQFYQEYELEIKKGNIKEDRTGIIDLG